MGEEDEVSVQEAAEAVVEAMDFHGEVTVSFGQRLGCLGPPCRRLCPDAPMALTLGARGWGHCCSALERDSSRPGPQGGPTDGEAGEHRDLCNPTHDTQPLFLSCHTYSMKLVTMTLSLWGVVMKVK